MASAEQRTGWAALQASAPLKRNGKLSPEEIEALRSHSQTCKAFLSQLPLDAAQELTGKTLTPDLTAATVSSAGSAHALARNAKGQIFDYFLVVDFEATCNEYQRGEGALKPQEIIEFPVALVNSGTLDVESTFHFYVKPVVHQILTPFCTELTGVTQEQVDAGLRLEDALSRLERWMEHHCLDVAGVRADRRRSFLFISCGDWDLNHLRSQCKKELLKEPSWCRQVCNLKYPYESVFGTRQVGMMGMLEGLQLQHTGKHHCGIHDVRNITAILVKLISDHAVTIEATPGSRVGQPFLGPSNAVMGLTPCDFITGGSPLRGALTGMPAVDASSKRDIVDVSADSSQDDLNVHFARSSYLTSRPYATLEDYRLRMKISASGFNSDMHPHLHRWFAHISYLMDRYGNFDCRGRCLLTGAASPEDSR